MKLDNSIYVIDPGDKIFEPLADWLGALGKSGKVMFM